MSSHAISAACKEEAANERVVPVSIGMPVFNGAKYIREALDSLLIQTFYDFELVISDNASTDDTQAICEMYALKDPRIRYLRASSNRGASQNFKLVLDQAKGEYFMWAAADDRWDHNWVENLYAHVKNTSQIACIGTVILMDENSLPLRHPANAAKLEFVGFRLWRRLSFYIFYEGLGKANLFYALYPRKLLQLSEINRYSIDYQILFSLLNHIAYAHVNGPRLHKRVHSEGAGVASQRLWRSPYIFAPFRLLQSDLEIVGNYMSTAGIGLKVLLLLLVPVKLFTALMFRLRKGILTLNNGIDN